MGRVDADGGAEDDVVVDGKTFQVRGIDGLRVVDASIWPDMPGFFIMLPQLLVSEKAARVIAAHATASEALLQ